MLFFKKSGRVFQATTEVFKMPSEFAEHSSETETPTTTHRWLGKNLGKLVTFESVFKNIIRTARFYKRR